MSNSGGKNSMKVGELKGAKNIIRIECSCSGIAIWIAHGNKKFDAKERRKFIESHKDHELSRYQARSTVF
jgi:hypothetical protein